MFQNYISYIKENPNKYWFRAKIYGWGWTPATREGWMVMMLYLGGIIFFAMRVDDSAPVGEILRRFLLSVGILTTVLFAICWKTGERPHWQWGLPKHHTEKE